MNNFNYAKKYHYMLKYFVMFIPLAILLVGHFRVVDSQLLESINSYVLELFTYLRGLSINSWYSSLLNVIGFNSIDGLSYILESYPLYIIWLYIFDIFVDLFGLIPRLAHKFITKFGGDY